MYTLLTTKLVMVVNKAHIKRMVRILLRALLNCNYVINITIRPIIIPTFFMTIKHNSIGIADLGIVHNCQHFLNSTESTNY